MLPFANATAAGAYYARRKNRISTAVIDDPQAPAWGTISWPANVGNNETIHINGTLITFITGTPSGAQVKIGATLAATLTAALDYLDAHPISGVLVSGSGNGLLILSTAPADTSVALSASVGTVSHATLQKQTINARVSL